VQTGSDEAERADRGDLLCRSRPAFALVILEDDHAVAGAERGLPDGERFVVFGTKGGAPTDPYWVRNVLADAEPSVELGDRVVAVRAAEITGAEADELYARQVERRPGFSEYKRKTSRWIPVLALDPVG
jgi:deazaflavin-dependent oxidoreductase (nitroreductase family)